MTISVVSLHPFAPVTVTVYVPGVVIFRSAIELTVVIPSDQLYVTPPVAERLMLVSSQVSSVAPVLLVIPGIRVIS